MLTNPLTKLDMTDSPEFDEWQWVNYWYPLTAVIAFKQKVYQALQEFAKINSVMEKIRLFDSSNFQFSYCKKKLNN